MNDLAVITTYYNYANYSNCKRNYLRFADQMNRLGLKLFTIEVAFGDSPFQIQGSFKYRTNSVLWYKENLINVGIRNNVPEKYKFIAWIDSDVEFVGIEAFRQAREKLEQYPVLQLFNKAVREDEFGLPEEIICSVPYWLSIKDKFPKVPRSVPGFAWAAQRSLIEKHGLYDISILGSGDAIFSPSIYGWFEDPVFKQFNKAFADEATLWAKKIHEDVVGNVGYVDYPIKHWWHGHEVNRNYSARNFLYRLYDFKPKDYLTKDSDGLLQWTSEGYLMQEAVKRYFTLRREDG